MTGMSPEGPSWRVKVLGSHARAQYLYGETHQISGVINVNLNNTYYITIIDPTVAIYIGICSEFLI
jgi:hypothetical protein